MDIIKQRKSIRKYDNRIISDEIIYELLEAGTYAPSSTNVQGWEYMLIDDLHIFKILAKESGNAMLRMVHQAILVLYKDELSPDDKVRANQLKAQEYLPMIQSGAACIENILLKAVEKGIGACWVTLLPSKNILKELLSIPNEIEIIGMITLGYPENEAIKKVRRKHNPCDITYHNGYGKKYFDKI